MWIYFPVVLTWAVSWWWWLQCWKRIASLCTERRVQQDCTVHRVQKCLKNVQKLCSVYSCCTEYQNVQKKMFKNWALLLQCAILLNAAFGKERCYALSALQSPSSTQSSSQNNWEIYSHLWEIYTTFCLLLRKKEKISAFDYYLKVRKCLFSIYFLILSLFSFTHVKITRKYNHTVFSTNYNAR